MEDAGLKYWIKQAKVSSLWVSSKQRTVDQCRSTPVSVDAGLSLLEWQGSDSKQKGWLAINDPSPGPKIPNIPLGSKEDTCY